MPPAPSQTKRRKRKQKKGPKRALSAYMYFVMLRREDLKKANPTISNKDLVSKLGALWREMTDGDKAEYNALAAKDKKRYEAAMAKYKK